MPMWIVALALILFGTAVIAAMYAALIVLHEEFMNKL